MYTAHFLTYGLSSDPVGAYRCQEASASAGSADSATLSIGGRQGCHLVDRSSFSLYSMFLCSLVSSQWTDYFQEPVVYYGRLLSDTEEGKWNPQSILIEGDIEESDVRLLLCVHSMKFILPFVNRASVRDCWPIV